jgi:pimeloyl-ACP methyl ester carboxylesterase
MKLALLLPGYLDSPDYLHFIVIEKKLIKLGYTVEKVDACNLWQTGDVDKYNSTNYLENIVNIINSYKLQNLQEIILIGHSFGGAIAIIAGSKYQEITKVIALCPAVSFWKSNDKWDETGFRFSKRDLPNNPKEFREFNIPLSFVEDRNKYSVSDSLEKLNKPLMVLMGMLDDKVLPTEIEEAMKSANDPYIIRMENMGHNFRSTEAEAESVAIEIEKFLIKISSLPSHSFS